LTSETPWPSKSHCSFSDFWGRVYQGRELVTRAPVKTLKLAIFLFLEFWLQIWFQKYHISPIGTEFLINKHKNRAGFCLLGPLWPAPSPDLESFQSPDFTEVYSVFTAAHPERPEATASLCAVRLADFSCIKKNIHYVVCMCMFSWFYLEFSVQANYVGIYDL
jgi:hypothetical protein